MNTLLKISFLLCFSVQMAFAQEPEYGIATRYSDQLQGTRTHSSALYDKDELTAAHKTLPFGTLVKVIRTDNNKSVIVRVNDRGPFVKGHVVDLSGRAAEQIGLDPEEEVKVKVLIAKANTKPSVKSKPKPKPEPEPVTEADRLLPVKKKKITPPPVKPKPKPKATPKPAQSKPAPKAQPARPAAPISAADDLSKDGLYKIQVMRQAGTGFGVQVASYNSYDNVLRHVGELQAKWFKNILVHSVNDPSGQGTYKIVLGPFPDRPTTEAYLKELKDNKAMGGFIVNLASLR